MTNDSTTATCLVGCCDAGEHEDAGPDDGADAEQGEVERGQASLRPVSHVSSAAIGLGAEYRQWHGVLPVIFMARLCLIKADAARRKIHVVKAFLAFAACLQHGKKVARYAHCQEKCGLGAFDVEYNTLNYSIGCVVYMNIMMGGRGYVMEGGTITLSGESGELLGSDAVQRAYLGLSGFNRDTWSLSDCCIVNCSTCVNSEFPQLTCPSKENKLNPHSSQPKSVIAVIATTLMALAVISVVTACSPKHLQRIAQHKPRYWLTRQSQQQKGNDC